MWQEISSKSERGCLLELGKASNIVGREACRLKESEMGILRKAEKSTVRAM